MNPSLPVTKINILEAPAGQDQIEVKTSLKFSALEPALAFVQNLVSLGALEIGTGAPITTAVVLNVATVAEFDSAWASLSGAVITAGGSVTIQFADGTYDFGSAQYLLNHPSGGQIKLLGNTSTPANCVLNFSGPSVPNTLGANMESSWAAIGVTNGNRIGGIDGFTMNGPGMRSENAYGFVCLMAWGGATINCGPHLILNNFYSGLAAFFGSVVYADGGVKVTGGGDGNIWAYGNSVISCVGCESSGADVFYSKSGLLADNGSYIFARSANIHDNGTALSLFTTSAASLAGATLSNCPYGIASYGGVGNSYESPQSNTCTVPFLSSGALTQDPSANTMVTAFDGQTHAGDSNTQEAIVVNRAYLGRWSQNGSIQHLLSINADGSACFGGSSPTAKGVNFWTLSNDIIRFGTNAALAITIGADQGVRFEAKVMMPNLPTADPHAAGELWNNSGVLTISAG